MNSIVKLILCVAMVFQHALLCTAQLKSVMVNACRDEGLNEYIIFQNSSSNLVYHADSLNFFYSTSPNPSTGLLDTIIQNGNQGFTDSLNIKLPASCPFQFQNYTINDTIPAYSKVIVFHETPSDTPNYSYWCNINTQDIYVLYSADPNWKTNGNFANAPSGKRYFRLIVKADTLDYFYENKWSSNRNGNFVKYDSINGIAGYGTYQNCNPSDMSSLPVKLSVFKIQALNNSARLYWQTTSEINNMGFNIWKRNELTDWYIISFVKSAGGNETTTNYEYYDIAQPAPNLEKTFYKLEQVDWNGDRHFSKVLTYNHSPPAGIFVFPNPASSYCYIQIDCDRIEGVIARDALGYAIQLDFEESGKVDLSRLTAGLYYLNIYYDSFRHTIPLIKCDE